MCSAFQKKVVFVEIEFETDEINIPQRILPRTGQA